MVASRGLAEMMRSGLLLAALCGVLAGSGVGCVQGAGDCAGTVEGDQCVFHPVRWTDASATAAALRFNDSPAVKGRLVQARCRIVYRQPGGTTDAACHAIFVTPSGARRKVLVAFTLSDGGGVTAGCARDWRSSPYCAGHDEPIFGARPPGTASSSTARSFPLATVCEHRGTLRSGVAS